MKKNLLILSTLLLSMLLILGIFQETNAKGFSCEEEIIWEIDTREDLCVPIPRENADVFHIFILHRDKDRVVTSSDFCQVSEKTGKILKYIKNIPGQTNLWYKFQYMQDTNFIIGPDWKSNTRIYNTSTGESEFLPLPGSFVWYIAEDNSIIYRQYADEENKDYNYFAKYDIKSKTTIAKFDKLIRMRGVSPVDDVGLFTDSKLQAYFGGNYMLIQAYDLYDHKTSDAIAYFHRYDHYMQSFLVDVRDMSLVHTFIDTLIIENAYFPNTPDPSKHYANSLIDTLRYHRSGFSDDASKIAMVPYNIKYTIDIFDTKTFTTKRLNLPSRVYERDDSGRPILFDSTGNYFITSSEFSF